MNNVTSEIRTGTINDTEVAYSITAKLNKWGQNTLFSNIDEIKVIKGGGVI